ncbi:MAG: tripartite tricarboxylate transporter substrate binding protein [Xanthobacteraceae bacterium]
MRRFTVLGLCVAASLIFAPMHSYADAYPSRPIHLIITSPAGSLTDVLGRLYAQELSANVGQPVVVDNRPGAMTQVGTDYLTHADADGYTLMLGASELTMLPSEKKNYPYDPTKDITPVALIATSWTMFAIYPKLPPQTLPEFIAYAKARPGKLHYGTNGVGGALQIAVKILELKTGIAMIDVPYHGGEQAANDAMSGQIEMVSMGLASARVAEGGRLRLLAQTGPSRHPLFPNVPTTAEYGLPDVRMDTWFGLVAPPKAPADIVERLDRATAEIEKEQSFRDSLAKIGCAAAYKSHADFAGFIADDLKKWRDLIPALGIPKFD